MKHEKHFPETLTLIKLTNRAADILMTWNNLLVFSGLVFEVVYSLPEEGDAVQAAVVVFKQQPGEEDKTKHVRSVCLTRSSSFHTLKKYTALASSLLDKKHNRLLRYLV